MSDSPPVKIRFFDLGLWRAWETQQMLKKILPKFTSNFEIYGFEACKEHYDKLTPVIKMGQGKVKFYHLAINNSPTQKIKLFHSQNRSYGIGHSIYDTKINVNKDSYEEVTAIRFSDWLQQEGIQLDEPNCLNIVKINIEGAEWDFFTDLVETNLRKHIHLFCGQGHDVNKIKTFNEDGTREKYWQLIQDQQIDIKRYSKYKPETNIDMEQEIKKLLAHL